MVLVLCWLCSASLFNNYPCLWEGNSEEYDLSIATCYLCSNYKVPGVLALRLEKSILFYLYFLSCVCRKSQLLKKSNALSTVTELIKSAWQSFVKALRIKSEPVYLLKTLL